MNKCINCGKETYGFFCAKCVEAEQAKEERMSEALGIAEMAGVSVAEVITELFPELDKEDG